MLLTVDATNRIGERVALRAMFEARKRVFVDLLKWDVPVLDGRFEVDQFDDDHAIYLVITDTEFGHRASARLLPTTRPGILNGLYPTLIDQPLPSGPDVYEITRFCLSPDMRAAERRRVRDALVMALARFALERGVSTYTGVAEIGWLQQILCFGWDARPLGMAQHIGRSVLGALRIDIAPDTLSKLAAGGICDAEGELMPVDRAA